MAKRLRRNPAVGVIEQGGMTVYQHPEFLDPAACGALMAAIDAQPRPSTLYGDDDDGFRTSFSCDLSPDLPIVRMLDERLAALTGLDLRNGEAAQGQRYAPGQQFKLHHDYFHTDQPYWEAERANGGQRSWTAMLYLNQPEAGGETNFGTAGICVSPQTGLLLVWNNMDAAGHPNPASLHEGCPVGSGTKYIITKWYRERFWVGHLQRR